MSRTVLPATALPKGIYIHPACGLVSGLATFSGGAWSRGLVEQSISQRQIRGSPESLIASLPDSERLVLVTSALPHLDLKMRSRPILRLSAMHAYLSTPHFF